MPPPPSPQYPSHLPLLILAAGLVDAHHQLPGPVALLLSEGPHPRSILASGIQAQVERHPLAPVATRIDATTRVIFPGFANAHAHLDLSHIGPRSFDPALGFRAFVDTVRKERHADPSAIAASVKLGIQKSLDGGTVAIGDIGGCPHSGPSLMAWKTLSDSPLRGTSFLEFFAIGAREAENFSRLQAILQTVSMKDFTNGKVQLGLHPHAPYSVGRDSFERAIEFARSNNVPICTHLAETPEEREFIAHATGPYRTFLESLALWNDTLAHALGRGQTPVEYLAPSLSTGRLAAVHVNQASDQDLDILAATDTPVIYCPRASSYFGSEKAFGPHRYQDMLERGIRVALGTDSIVNLPDASRISILDEVRFLVKRDGVPPMQAFQMSWIHGANFLGQDPLGFGLRTGDRPLGILGLPCLKPGLPTVASLVTPDDSASDKLDWICPPILG